jgi:hypothetical protein
MGMLLTGLNIIRDELASVIDKAEIGTGTSTPTAQDTSLTTPLGIFASDVTVTTADQYILITATFPSTEAAGQAVTEILFSNEASSLPLLKVVFEQATTYTTTRDLIIDTRVYVRGRR